MSSAVAELEAGLQAMQGLKPPGVSGSRITSLTALCVSNVQSESVLIQKLYTHFKKAPGTHKLGVLYVVDSVTRKWLDQAKQNGQAVNGSAPDGTYAAGVNRVTELIPVLMNDILSSAPADQKDKIRKLVDIWEKGQTFPPKLIESFKEKLNAPQPNDSTTPPGSPPANVLGPGAARPGAPAAGPPAIPPNIMETLANLAKQSSAAASAPAPLPTATATPPTLAGPFGGAVPGAANAGLPQHLLNQPPYITQAPAPAPVNAQQPLAFQMPQAQQQPQQPSFQMPFGAPASNQLPPGFSGMPGAGVTPQQQQQQPAANVQQNLLFIQALLAQGLSLDQISGVLSQVAGGNAAGAPGAPGSAPPASLVPSAIAAAAAAAAGAGGASAGLPQYPFLPGAQSSSGAPPPDWNNASSSGGRMDSSRDHGYGGRSPRGGGRGRSRSRSPRYWDSHGSPKGSGRDDHHGRRSSPSGRGDRDRDRGRGRDYRQRSPPPGNNSGGGRRGGGSEHVPPPPPAPSEKWVEHDPSLPPGSIRVLSRTLFVGGVTISEAELRSIFGRYGDVQTCIVNKEKRHAFVKMYTRKEAEAAKIGMEQGRSDDTGLRTRWGVGFGPRDCSDYSKGVSVIPISKLTEADRKWLLTAPWGGSGGRPIATGLVVEEPDIEIGAGVSSKAISRRMQTDRGGINGPRSTRREEELASGNTNSHPNSNGNNGGGSGGGGRHTRRGGGGGGGGRDRRGDELNYGDAGNGGSAAHGDSGGNDSSAAFPFGLAIGANGIPIFPPGFAFPAPDNSS